MDVAKLNPCSTEQSFLRQNFSVSSFLANCEDTVNLHVCWQALYPFRSAVCARQEPLQFNIRNVCEAEGCLVALSGWYNSTVL